MRAFFYTFQLSRFAALAVRSRNNDVDLVTFGTLLNKREQGRGAAVTPIWKGMTYSGQDITEGARINDHPFSFVNITKDWIIGPTEVRRDDTIDIVVTVTNTGDSQLRTADQQKVDEWTISALNIYYSWLLGQFMSGLGLKALAEFVGGTAASAVAGFLADPVGRVLGYEPTGPCNGLVLADVLSFTARELDSLEFRQEAQAQVGRDYRFPVAEVAVVTRSYIGKEGHSEERCGEMARSEIDLTVRRYDYWSLRQHLFTSGRSLRRRHPSGGSLKQLAGIRL